ncbi:MAG: phosphoserine transaminase [Actinomycetota bacterium]|nr:phosphoserine transaminase [Actinomycetota bacterium]
MTATETSISLPTALLPKDGRFGSGPSKVRPEAIHALSSLAQDYLGTSHRRATVKDQVSRLRSGLINLFDLPDGWEIILGNGGTTLFWDAASFGLIEYVSQHLDFGEFSSKFAQVVQAAPHLAEPQIISSEPGTHPLPIASNVDTYALTHNETSTGVSAVLSRPTSEGLVLVDATSAAGAIQWNSSEVDCYYFAPQKALASDGGLWLAACSPRAVERIELLASGDRWIPAGLDLGIALTNSRQNQTYNTPSLATIFLAAETVDWINESGGLQWSEARCRASSDTIYQWADARPFAEPFVIDAGQRSPVVCTIDFDGVEADAISRVLRANGILDTESYRKLGRNQLRIATFPAVDPDDVRALCACIDYIVESLT